MESKKGLRKGMLVATKSDTVYPIVKIAQTKFDKERDNNEWVKIWKNKTQAHRGEPFASWTHISNLRLPTLAEKKGWK